MSSSHGRFQGARLRRLTLLLLLALPSAHGRAAPPADPVPIMAYYYIWYSPTSWDRAKSDYPLLGRYSSDDEAIMREHVRRAKAAGIDGFIVSWKSTGALDARLERLMTVAAAQDFRLWIIYQGLDFERNPLPLSRVDSDLELFVERYAEHPAFGGLDKPVIIWSGTWAYSRTEVASVAQGYRDRLYLLASERNLKGYLRVADLVDGDAYYWSSVNPDTFPDYPRKLVALGEAVHRRGGLWVAPAAPGFDARLLGGKTVVARRDGETLQRELNAALTSSPDAIGLISWNEFSENSHVEPSERYGIRALEVLADRGLSDVPQPFPFEFDSSAPDSTDRAQLRGVAVLTGTLALLGVSLVLVWLRSRALEREKPGQRGKDTYA